MPASPKNRLAPFLGRTAVAGDGLGDGQLLARFVRGQDGDAFAALVRRHGPMVLAVCGRVLGNRHDAEDAFQAVFLVLARKARSVLAVASLGGWLARVAFRAAYRARADRARLRAREQTMSKLPHPTTGPDEPNDLLTLLDQEIDRLPEKYRLPVVLCELGGKSRKQAARELGLAEGTLSWRLAHARKVLARRLARHRGALSVAALTGLLTPASTSPSLVRSATEAALQVAAGTGLPAGLISHRVLTLVEGVTKAMFLTKLKVYGLVLVVLVGAGAAGLTIRSASAQDPTSPQGRAREARWADALDELRLEVAALRKGLEVTRQDVKALQADVQALRGGRPAGGQPAAGGMAMPGMGAMRGMMPGMSAMGDGMSPGMQSMGTAMMPGGPAGRSRADEASRVAREADAKLRDMENEYRRQLSPAGTDPVADAEAALKKLKAHPGDKQATEALEKALQRLKQPQSKGYEGLQRK